MISNLPVDDILYHDSDACHRVKLQAVSAIESAAMKISFYFYSLSTDSEDPSYYL